MKAFKLPLPRLVAPLVLAGSLLGLTSKAHAFGGEDPVFGHPWHHEMITKDGAADAGFSTEAAASIAWSADYVDSYLYNPLWWGAGGFNRFKAARAQADYLERVHFDDLFTTEKVNIMWRRYASGTFAGLMWAAEKKDVPAAQHIIGVSLHAMQDFYSHSNWVDKPERRKITFFQTPVAQRSSQPLYTGAYEHSENNGVKHHGKWLYTAAIFRAPGVEPIMEAACSAISPLSNEPMCADYKLSKTGVAVRPSIQGVKIPDDVLVMAPQGIALDNTWVAAVGVKQRGLTDMDGVQGFTTARTLAQFQTKQWLLTLEKAMQDAGEGDFWTKVKNDPTPQAEREAQYEKLGKVPHTFLSAGTYPPTSATEEYFLRLKIRTANDFGAGTDADIKAKVNGQETLLDWMPRAIPGYAVNDFEAGDEDVYTLGPFSSMPTSVELYNDSATGGEVLAAAGRAFVNAVTGIPGKIGAVYTKITAGAADHIATNRQVWMPQDLEALTATPKEFKVPLNGGQEGNYIVHGTIAKSSSDANYLRIDVRLTQLECVKESKWDRGSSSDEPFVLAALNPLPGDVQPYKTEPYSDVDSGESRNIDYSFNFVSIPRGSGMLNLGLSVMEHDDESSKTRGELLAKFAGQTDDATEESRRNFTTALGAAVAADWKIANLEVTAWSRMGRVQVGTVFNEPVNRWLKGKERVSYPLDNSKLRQVALTNNLLPYIVPEHGASPVEGGTPAEGTPTEGTENPLPDGGANAGGATTDLDAWLGVWETNWGTLTLTRNGDKLVGTIKRKGPYGLEQQGESFVIGGGYDGVSVEGTYKLGDSTTYKGSARWVLSEDGNSFSGEVTRDWLNDGQITGDPFSGRRVGAKPNTTGTGTGNTGTGTTTGTPANGNTGIVPPKNGTGGGATSGGGYVRLTDFDVRIDSATINAAANQLQIVVSFKNQADAARRLDASLMTFVVTDADGIGIRNIGNIYSATGDRPEIIGAPTADSKGELKVRYLIDLTDGSAPLRTLSVREYGKSPQVFDLSRIPFEGATPAATTQGLAGGNATFAQLNDVWDGRFDGIKARRGGGYEAFVSFKNASKQVQAITASSFVIQLYDANQGAKRQIGNLYRANGDRPVQVSNTLQVEPNGIVRLRFLFDTTESFVPSKVSIKESYSKAQPEFPVLTP